MFSKALFKQSCKANGMMWAIITLAVCIMLSCLMGISGGGNVGEMKTGIANTIVQDAMDVNIEGRTINYYNLVDSGLTYFDAGYSVGGVEGGKAQLNAFIENVCNDRKIADGSLEKMEIIGLCFGPLTGDINGDNVQDYSPTYLEKGSMTREDYARDYTAFFISTNMTTESNIDMVVAQLEKYSITKEEYSRLTYTDAEGNEVSRYTGESGKAYIKDLALDSIVTYNARCNYEISKITIDPATQPAKYQAEVLKIKAQVGEKYKKSFLTSLPKSVSESLEELGTMDLFSLITGSIYFKMAGLLLPIIYIIMVANNLVAGQVDSGSMAYVLSTSTKRKQVVFTQSVFLVLSIFAMCLCTTITSFISLSTLNNSTISLTYGKLALLNLGAFVTLFAMSGISFFASCYFNRSKYSLGFGGGINMFFLVSTILGLFGSKVLPTVVRIDSLKFFNYCTIISLFDELSILNGTTTFIWKFAILLAVGIGFYIAGSLKFKKKDLPL